MLETYCNLDGEGFHPLPNRPLDALWIDLFNPTPEEERSVESALGIEVPTREEMREVESSSALYREHGATFVTIRVVDHGPLGEPRIASVTLVLTQSHFLTIRYSDPTSFQQFRAHMQKTREHISAVSAMLCLLEAVVDRDADLLEEITDQMEGISTEIFRQNAAHMESIAAADLGGVLKRIGDAGELSSRVRQSLHSIGRSVPFLVLQDMTEVRGRLRTLTRDVQSLMEHDGFIQTQVQFLLDSCVGLISIQQNAIMKLLSVATVVFLPPTLIGSIYGMNFERIPMLHTPNGFYIALAMMVITAGAPLIFFRIKRWF